MDFRLNTAQQALADTVARWCANAYSGAARKQRLDAGPEGGTALWADMSAMGWHGAGVGESDGGFGGGVVENAILMEAFGRALVVEPFLSSSVLALQTLVALPEGDLRDELVAGAIAGEHVLAIAHVEDGNGEEIAGIRTAATHTHAGWHVDGSKSFAVGAPCARKILLSARTTSGIGLFVADADSVAPMSRPYRTLDNLHAADYRLTAAPVLAMELDSRRAEAALAHGMAHALVAQCAEAVGAMDTAISLTVDYVRTRRQFGQTLNGFQSVQHRLADMLVEAELSRSILYSGMAALTRDGAQRVRALSAMKAVVARAALFVGRQAIQLHGGMGITEDCFVSHLYRRLFVIAGQFGNESFHLSRMARTAPDDPDAPQIAPTP